MITPQDVIHFVEARTGHPIGREEGLTFGPRAQELTGVTVAWTCDESVIQRAVQAGHNCIVHHEELVMPLPGFSSDLYRHSLSWPANVKRLGLLSRHDITTIRMHASLDELYIFDAFARQLRLGNPIENAVQYSHKVYASPVPTFGALVEHVKECMSMAGMRVSTHDLDRPVNRIGLPWGGLGLFVNVHYVQMALDLGADTLIYGESDNLAMRMATESGAAFIETSHEISEAQGLEDFARHLNDSLDVTCAYTPVPCVWRMG
ncbi:Nif3-like dinuclear metal center hexameric protein [bacterium]|nr:Nif3-like dinuclear metal center hexameric protein [bacterium]